MKNRFLFLVILLLVGSLSLWADISSEKNEISLAGRWKGLLDEKGSFSEAEVSKLLQKEEKSFEIILPGTLDEAGVGEVVSGVDYGILSRCFQYIGVAWYSRNIEIPQKWNRQPLMLMLERVLWESVVYIDGVEISTQDGLGSAHLHPLQMLSPGSHRLSIRINNKMIHNIGDKGHAYGDYMQSIWNGMVGEIKLYPVPFVNRSLRIFSDLEAGRVWVGSDAFDSSAALESVFTQIIAPDGTVAASIQWQDDLSAVLAGGFEIVLTQPALKWDEFSKNLYTLKMIASGGGVSQSIEDTFGFCLVKTDREKLFINGHKAFLRGNLDCIHFPLTGYPSPYKKDWVNIFKIYKDYGLNHVRFHSWCPPEAAFDAADELGIYIQAEASIWIDQWMGRDNPGRPEMNTQGQPQGLGKDPDADAFVQAEIRRVIDAYGNHPSFLFFCIGNELGSSDFNVMEKWIAEAQKYDPRRLYAASTARKITKSCQYNASHYSVKTGSLRERRVNHTNWDYQLNYHRATVPMIAHEIGQWPVYPLWNEIDKYQGVFEARNLIELKDRAAANEMASDKMNRRMQYASGKLNQMMYKDEIESFLRTKSCSGFQLLSMQDYSGQGEALIGWLDSFYDSKGIVSAQEFRNHCAPSVLLARFNDYIQMGESRMKIRFDVAHYGETDVRDAVLSWRIVSRKKGTVLVSGLKKNITLEAGELKRIASVRFKLPQVEEPLECQLISELSSESLSIQNRWPLYLFPAEEKELPADGLEVVDSLDLQKINRLKEGAVFLLDASDCGGEENRRYSSWRPLYWSSSFFPGQSIDTLGTWINNSHPALKGMPSRDWADWLWFDLTDRGVGFDLSVFPKKFEPIIQPVSDFHFSRKLGTLFEFKLGKGKLLVSGYPLESKSGKHPEIVSYKNSLINYIKSEDFEPLQEVRPEWLQRQFKSGGVFPRSTVLHFEAVEGERVSLPSVEDVLLYPLSNSFEKSKNCWLGDRLSFRLDLPDGFRGNLILSFLKELQYASRVEVTIDGRTVQGNIDKKGELEFFMMREDTNDGVVDFTVRPLRNKPVALKGVGVASSE